MDQSQILEGSRVTVVALQPRMDDLPSRASRSSGGNCYSIKEKEEAGAEEGSSAILPHLQFCSLGPEGSHFNGNRKWIIDYYIKYPLLANALICAFLLIKCYRGTIGADTAPLTVFIAYSIANAYIILEYRIWQRISRLSKQIFGIIAALAFVMEGTKEMYASNLYTTSINERDKFTTPSTKVEDANLSLLAALSLIEAGLYFVEVFNLTV